MAWRHVHEHGDGRSGGLGEGTILMAELTCGTPEEAGMDPERIAMIRARIPQWMDGVYERGGVFLAARRGKIILHEACGTQTDKPGSPPMATNSIFQVSSISKPITATGVMILVEEGRIGLNRPIKEYLPELNGEGVDDVEVQHLLTHTSGFKEDECWEHYGLKKLKTSPVQADPGQFQEVADYLASMIDVKSWYAPGSLMDYCNHNYLLLSEIVRRVSGIPVERFYKERIFEPLGMEGTDYIPDATKLARRVVRGDGAQAGSVAGQPEAGVEGTWMSGVPWGFIGVNTTALDLAILGQTYLNHGTYGQVDLLSRSAVHEMTRNQIPGVGCHMLGRFYPEASWGLGWMVQGDHRWKFYNATLTPKGTFYHSGQGGGQFWIDRENEIVGVYLSVCMVDQDDFTDTVWNADHFMDMVTAAIVD